MFGKDALLCEQVSEDEDWGPGKRRRREKESDAISTLMTLHESENKEPNVKRSCFRIPHHAVEVLIAAILVVIFLYSHFLTFWLITSI